MQGRSCEDIISTLRNGSAAENAVAKMHEKGLLAITNKASELK